MFLLKVEIAPIEKKMREAANDSLFMCYIELQMH